MKNNLFSRVGCSGSNFAVKFILSVGLFGWLTCAGAAISVAGQENIPVENKKVRAAQKQSGKSGAQSVQNKAASEPDKQAIVRLKAKLAKKQQQAKLNRFDQPDKAIEYYLQKRLPAGEKELPLEKYLEAKEAIERMPLYSTAKRRYLSEEERSAVAESDVTEEKAAALGTWSPLGPGNVGGRTRAILVHPTTPATMYAAGVAGGVWKSTNSGASWTALTDSMANIAVTAMAMQPGTPDTIYAGTGEGFFNVDAVRGLGIFKTTNGGTTWTQLANTSNANFHYVFDVVVSTANPTNVYAATSTGVWRSLDGGANWTRVVTASNCTDLAIRTDQATNDSVFASCGHFAQGTIFRKTDAQLAGAWTNVHSAAGMQRTSLAIAPSNQSVIYAMSTTNSQAMHAIYRSTSNGDAGTWNVRVDSSNPTKLNTVQMTNPVFAFLADCGFGGANQFFTQGWYDNVIAVDPADANRVWTGGIDLFRSDDGGANWGQASHWWASTTTAQYTHADIHNITFHPQYNGTTNQTMFVGNDGGIFRSTNARAATATGPLAPCNPANSSVAFTSLNNGYGVTQFYHGVVYPNGTTYFGGLQDNGTVRGTDGGGANAWATILGGDGAYVAVDTANTNNLIAQTQNTDIQKSTNGGANFVSARSGIVGSGLFITPIATDPGNSQRLWTGTTVIYRTTNFATNWVQAGVDFGSNVSAMSIHPTDGNRVLAGTETGSIRRSTTALSDTSATVWASSTPRSAYVSWIAFHPTNNQIAYATYSTFGGTKVYRTADGGATWTGLPGTGANVLPDVPAHTIVVNPANTNQLYVGTDAGVFFSPDQGANWSPENTGFPNTVVETLAIGNIAGVPHLYAFTHGRSAWRVSLVEPTAAAVSIGGRILNANGRAVSRAIVRLTDSSGNTRQTMTNTFGYYRFDEVQTGETYTVRVSAKAGSFAPRVITVLDELTDLNFTPQN